MFTIRPATQADSPAIASVIKEVYNEYGFEWDPADYHADLYDLDRYYFERGHAFWIAERDGHAVGTVALERYPMLPGDRGEVIPVDGRLRIAATDCALERLYVRPSARKDGIGKALLATTLDAARAGGRQAMEVWSDKRFEAAHRLYQRAGATIVGERLCHDSEQSPEWGLLLPI